MLRSVLAVVVSYIAMTILVMAGFMGLWFGLGPDRLLQPGSYQGSMLMNIAAPGVTVICGLFGGWMCYKIARSGRPGMVLAGIVMVAGLIMAYFTLQKPEPTGPRAPGMTVQQVFEKGREPTWFAILNPVFGAGGVLLGGCCLGCCKKKP